ncbi:MAG: hypothetical protein M1818_004825 [Claussenomyces sp. TS43310]|nr:MAG: hypothetical protein M1818_004825 [Claussenomyces sp. TS43310]
MAEHAGKKTAIVVGAGAGGVATAARLAKAGLDVTVIEKNDFTGGRCSFIHHDGYRFDQGPSLLLIPKLFKETFHDLGTSFEKEGIELLKCEPNYNIWFGDGECFELSTDTAVMKREVEKWEGKEGFQRYLAWLSEAHFHYEISVSEVLHKNFTSIFNLARWSFVTNVLKLHAFESIYSRASRYFFTERLRRAFTFSSMYMGMSPFDAPGTYSLLQYTELAEGIWYPSGGFNGIVAALVRIGEKFGVKYRLNTAVASVTTSPDGKTATGVKLASGEELHADVVVVNADLVYAYNNLFPSTSSNAAAPKQSSYAKSLSKRAGSCSSISFFWSLSRRAPNLHPHNIFLANDYRESFDSIFKRHDIPEEPSFYVNVPSRIDPSAAPPGADAMVVLVPVGHLRNSKIHASEIDASDLRSGENRGDSGAGLSIDGDVDMDRMVDLARTTILSTIKARTGADLAPLITNEIVNTPLTWETKFNLDRGSILGLSHDFFNVLAFRPSITHRHLRNCYFVGASTHPGTGLPIVLAGGKITSTKVLEDLNMDLPWSEQGWEDTIRDRGVQQGKGTKDIDRLHVPWSQFSEGQVAVAVLMLLVALCLGYVMRGS